MFGHILKTIKSVFTRKAQTVGDSKKYTKKIIPTKAPITKNAPKKKLHYTPQIAHGREQVTCRWWDEIGRGYVIKKDLKKRRLLVAFSFLGAHRKHEMNRKKWTGPRGSIMWLHESEVA